MNWKDISHELKDPFTRGATFHHRRLHARVAGILVTTLLLGFFVTWTMWAFQG